MHRHSRKVDEHYLKSLELLFFGTYTTYLDFLGGSAVKNLPAAQEMWVPSLGWEDALEEGMATSPGDVGSIPGLGRCLGGGHGNPLQYYCLENTCGQRSLAGYI